MHMAMSYVNMQVSEEEWRAKYEAMRAALPQYKTMKKELGDLEVTCVCVCAYLVCPWCRVDQ
jgi:hypothetical protein